MTDSNPPQQQPTTPALKSAIVSFVEAFEKAQTDLLSLLSGESKLEITITNVKTLAIKTSYQMDLARKLREGEIALLSWLDELHDRANQHDKVPQEVATLKFWLSVEPENRPVVGSTYERLFQYREQIADRIEEWRVLSPRLEEINQWLASMKTELGLVLSGHANQNQLVLIGKEWASLCAKTYPGPEPPIIMERWGDMESSDDDDNMPLLLTSLARSRGSNTTGIRLPGDFNECFPTLGRQLARFCRAHKWSVELDANVKLRSQGLVTFEEKADHTISTSDKLEDIHRLALVSLYTSVGSLFLKPQSLTVGDSTEVALTYVCALIASEKLANKNKELLTVALKQKDGNKAALFNRFYTLCRTGNSAMKMIIEAVDKCLSKFARELDPSKLGGETLNQITKRAFTSTDGMLANASRTTLRSRTVLEKVTDRRGGTTTIKKVQRVEGQLSADLLVAGQPLKPEELTTALSLREKFNDRRAVAEIRLAARADKNDNLFAKPEVCKAVMSEAYAKAAAYRSILKARKDNIRIEATKLNNGKKPDPSHWATAKALVLENTSAIPESVWKQLSWIELTYE